MNSFIVQLFLLTSGFVFSQGVLPVHRYFNKNGINLIWDATIGNGQVNNDSGTWGVANNWLKSPNGINLAWTSDSNAVFGGSPGVGVAGTVTVSLSQNVKNLTFNATPSGNFILSGGTLTLSTGIITVNQSATINSTLTGSVNLVKKGGAALTLGGNNSITGNFVISQGDLNLNTVTAAGTANIILGDNNTGISNVGWFWGGGFTPPNNITVTTNGTGTATIGTFSGGLFTTQKGTVSLNRATTFFDATNDRSSFEGVISGNPGIITIDGVGTYSSAAGQIARVTFDNNSNTFTALINVLATKAFQLNGSTVANNNPIQCNGDLVINSASAAVGVIGTLTGSGRVAIHPGTSGAYNLTLGNDNGTGAFSGTITNGGGVLSITKAGIGTETLSATNNYTGSTTCTTGILNFSTLLPSSASWIIGVSNSAPTVANSGRITLPNAPNLTGRTINILLTESGTGVSWVATNWTGTATGAPALQVNGAARTSGVTTNGTRVTYNTITGITVTR
jgi:autotransporter-associated beta strand protein